MSDEHLSQTQIQREADQAIARAQELRKQAAARRRNKRRISFGIFGLILLVYIITLILIWPR